MKKLLAIVLTVALVFALAACGGTTPPAGDSGSASDSGSMSGSGSASGADTSLDDVIAAKQIVMLTNAGFPPFEYVDETTPIGVDVDVAQAIADAIGVELKVVDMDFDGLINALASGKGDFVAAGMTVTEERQQNVDFTVEYVTSSQYMIIKDGATYKTLEDLKGKKIGVQTGTTGDFICTDAVELDDGVLKGSGAEVKYYKTALEAALDLNTGRLDAVVVDMHPAKAIAEKNEGLVVAPEAISDSESYAIAVNKGDKALLDKINEVLTQLIADGKIAEFLVKHTS